MKTDFNSSKRYLNIIIYNAIALLKAERKHNYIGYIWEILNPLINLALLYIVFGVMNRDRSLSFVFYLLIGLLSFQWFESSVVASLDGIKGHLNTFKTVKAPKYIFIIPPILVNTWKFVITFSILIIGLNFFENHSSFMLCYLPLTLAVQLYLIISISIPLCIMCTFLTDFREVIHTIMRVLFFLSGIFFHIDKVPESICSFTFI